MAAVRVVLFLQFPREIYHHGLRDTALLLGFGIVRMGQTKIAILTALVVK